MNPRHKNILIFLVFFVLLFPFLILLTKINLHLHFDVDEFFWALKNTFLQAGLSAVGALLFGTWAGFGLLRLNSRWRSVAEVGLLIPNFLPPLFSLLVAFYWMDPFPIGVLGISLVHSMINFGVVAVALGRLIEVRLGALSELAQIEGSGRFFFLRHSFWPLLKKDYLGLFLFVFSVCFTSFSVPLIVGGGRGTTLEVLIYEKIRLSMEWGGALLLSLFQWAVIGSWAFVLLRFEKKQGYQGPLERKSASWLASWSGLGFVGVFISLFFIGYLDDVAHGFHSLSLMSELRNAVIDGILGTFAMGLLTGGLILVALKLLAFLHDQPRIQQILYSYLAPSTTLTGFAFLILGPNDGLWSFAKIPMGLFILFIGPIYRLGWSREVEVLRQQIGVAEVLGADDKLIFSEVIWPQLRRRAYFLSGVGAAWACGDFALSRILAYKDITLGLLAETFMSTYRMGLAGLLSFFVLILGLICFLLFWSFGHVHR